MFLEFISCTPADIPKATLQHAGCILVVNVNAVRGDDHSVRFASNEPCRLFLDALIRFEHRWLHLGVGVVKSQDEFSIVHFSICAVNDQATGVPKGKGSVGVWCKPQHDLPTLCVFKVGQPFPPSFCLSLFKQVGGLTFENTANRIKTLFSGHRIGIGHAFCNESRNILSVLLEVFSHAHNASDDRTNGCLSLVFQRVLQRNMIDEVQRLVIWTPRHVAQTNQTTPLQEMRVSSCWKSWR